MIAAYLPGPGNIAAVAITWGVGAIVLLGGAALSRRPNPPEIGFGAGWGALCLALTVWGVFLPLSLRVPAIAFAVIAVAGLAAPRLRLPRGEWRSVKRVIVLSLPLWLVMAPIRPSQPDTFLNLLPNAMYLVDYGRFPTSHLPPSFSYLPAAPYNTQFLSFLGALADPGFPPSGMSLVNVMLFLFAGLAIARELAGAAAKPGEALPWGVIALGLLLAVLLNPGFVPRIDFAAYGEPALMVTALLAAILFVRAQSALAAGGAAEGLAALALILAAMLNAKQSGIGLVAALVGAAAIAGWGERGVPRRAWLRFVALAPLPALILYAVWRYYVARAGVAELTVLPAAAWNWAVLPQTLASIAGEVAEKPVYFGAVAIAIVLLPVWLRRHGWTATTRLLALHAAAFMLYNLFLMAAYVAQFSAEMSAQAHSYFRYNTHLSLMLTLALALVARDAGIGALLTRSRRPAAAAALALALLAPLGFTRRLRFDLVMPQPLVWNLASRLKPHLRADSRLALLLPGDNDSVATMLAGVLRDVPPRRPRLDLLRRRRADAATLAEAARRGYQAALISCTPGGLAGLPPGVAALVASDPTGWRPIAVWPYPPDMTRQRWQYILSWQPLCRKP